MADLVGKEVGGTAVPDSNSEVLRQRRAEGRKFSIPGFGGHSSKKAGGLEDGNGDTNSADQLLEAMGYQPELSRNRSTLQVAFMSFVLASIPYGLATTFFYPLVGGGPANIIWGWVTVSIIILCVAASLGEITSVYPTAGGVYYQTFMLSPPSFRRIASWICGWSYVVGNITITLAVNFGTTLFLVACINVFENEEGEGVFEGKTYQVFLIFLGITLLCNAISSLGNKWLPILDVCFSPRLRLSHDPVLFFANPLAPPKRHLPFSGPLPESLQWSSPSSLSRRTAATPATTSSAILSHNQAGHRAGRSVSVCCRPHTQPPQQA